MALFVQKVFSCIPLKKFLEKTWKKPENSPTLISITVGATWEVVESVSCLFRE